MSDNTDLSKSAAERHPDNRGFLPEGNGEIVPGTPLDRIRQASDDAEQLRAIREHAQRIAAGGAGSTADSAGSQPESPKPAVSGAPEAAVPAAGAAADPETEKVLNEIFQGSRNPEGLFDTEGTDPSDAVDKLNSLISKG